MLFDLYTILSYLLSTDLGTFRVLPFGITVSRPFFAPLSGCRSFPGCLLGVECTADDGSGLPAGFSGC